MSLNNRNSNLINIPLKNHSVDKNINSYIEKIENDDKNLNYNENKLNEIEKDKNNEQNINDNEKVIKKKEKNSNTLKEKGYMSQNTFKKILQEYENKIMNDRYENRSIEESLDKAWELLRKFPYEELTKIPDAIKKKYYSREDFVHNKKIEEKNKK